MNLAHGRWVLLVSLLVASPAGAKHGPPHKVAICHIPPGNPANAHTLSLPEPAIRAHLGHGDKLGACTGTVTDRGKSGKKKESGQAETTQKQGAQQVGEKGQQGVAADEESEKPE
jgi:hypothetical protein